MTVAFCRNESAARGQVGPWFAACAGSRALAEADAALRGQLAPFGRLCARPAVPGGGH
jgi:hypothetical protein